jgi:hypothetical protein
VENVWPAVAACAGISSLFPVLLRLRRGVRGTALESAWACAAFVWLFWLVVTGLNVADRVGESSSLHAWIDVFWYLAAALALTPPVAVLGARRPTARVWTAFVLIPLVLVFAWPVLTLRTGFGPVAFALEPPLCAGFALVLVMGAGNYLGLRFSLSAVLWIAGLLLVVLPLCPATSGWAFQADTGRALGTLCLVASAWLADRQAAGGNTRTPAAGASVDRVWRDFRDLFGIVWARRIQERFNDEAHKQGLPFRLGIDGLESATGASPGASLDIQSLAAAEASLRWLLQKFVDREWIDRRLASQ